MLFKTLLQLLITFRMKMMSTTVVQVLMVTIERLMVSLYLLTFSTVIIPMRTLKTTTSNNHYLIMVRLIKVVRDTEIQSKPMPTLTTQIKRSIKESLIDLPTKGETTVIVEEANKLKETRKSCLKLLTKMKLSLIKLEQTP